MTVWQRQEHDIVLSQVGRLGLFNGASVQFHQVGHEGFNTLTCVRSACQCPNGHGAGPILRMGEKEPEDFATRVSRRSGYCH